MSQRNVFKIFVYIFLLVIAIGLLVWWVVYNNARSRDYDRLAQIKLLQLELTDYFFEFNTFQIPQCPTDSLVNYCLGRGDRTLAVSGIIDPKNRGNFQFIFEEILQNDFAVSFSLEQGVGGLSAGNYVLTKEGIRR